jgi:putative hydrolase of the HAD superfamily
MIKAVVFDMFETLITHTQSPLYFGSQMAADAKIPEEKFQALWLPTGEARTIGAMTLEEALTMILEKNHCYSEELLHIMVKKRVSTKEDCFSHLHPQILPLLDGLKKRGLSIGLISNCFSEEVGVIRNSALFPYFDAALLSFEQGLQKPDREIFTRCMEQLKVKAEECLYVGDGGSFELEAATELGMKALQAIWYLPCGNEPMDHGNLLRINAPLDVLNQIV